LNTLRYPVGRVLAGKEPKLTIRIIGKCNFRCPLCSTFSSPERQGILSLPDFNSILHLLVENHFRGVLNISGGETTLHPELIEMVSLASQNLKKSRIVVFTNGDWVGQRGWRKRLRELLQGTNVLVRFSLDRLHAEGKAIALYGSARKRIVGEIEKDRLKKARHFFAACLQEKAKPGLHFDFAFKGTAFEAQEYMSSLGHVPIYPIHFQKDPAKRPKQLGYLAVDLDKNGKAQLYLTLGHIAEGEALGGIEALPLALKMNREALKTTI